MTTVYPSDTSHCALCECRIKATQHVALYVVSAHAAIGYALCDTCGPKARRGLPPEQLHKLDAKLEAVAKSHGLTGTQ